MRKSGKRQTNGQAKKWCQDMKSRLSKSEMYHGSYSVTHQQKHYKVYVDGASVEIFPSPTKPSIEKILLRKVGKQAKQSLPVNNEV